MPRQSSVKLIIAFRGVLISWDMFARNSDFDLFAAIATSFAFSSSPSILLLSSTSFARPSLARAKSKVRSLTCFEKLI